MFKKDLLRISPFYRYTELVPGEGNPGNCLTEYLTLPAENKKKIAALDRCGTEGFGTLVNNDCIFLMMPWLWNADINTYLEIIEKNKTEFEAYNLKLERLSKSADNTEIFLKDFEYDLREANNNIMAELEKKKAELKAHGIATAISVAITAVPFFLPKDGSIDPALLTQLFGVCDGVEIIHDVGELSSIGSVGRSNPFWVLWKWKNKS